MDLLIFFVFPVAVILSSIVLESTIRKPLMVALTVFTIFFILEFTVYVSDTTFIVATVIYTVLAYVTALITEIIIRNLPSFLRLNFGEEFKPHRERRKNSTTSTLDLINIDNNSNDNNNDIYEYKNSREDNIDPDINFIDLDSDNDRISSHRRRKRRFV